LKINRAKGKGIVCLWPLNARCSMAFKLPPLPYELDALSPYISRETLEFHYGKHHRTYVDKLNKLIEENPKYRQKELEEIILGSDGPVFNNAAQVWNHTFQWNCMAPRTPEKPGGAIAEALKQKFGSFEKFKEEFTEKAVSLFGSGYVWLVRNEQGVLSVEQTKDADNPLTKGQQAILTCDVWEHAYYIDRRNDRAKYLEAFWKVVHWDFVESQLEEAGTFATLSHSLKA
jgi:superoxide dismutase, Fe-Mn family